MAELIKKSWMSDEQFQVWLDYYMEAGGSGVPNAEASALASFRDDTRYTTWFPGIKDEDGAIRYEENPELTYHRNIEGYKNVVEGYNMSTEIFEDEYIDLIEGDVTVNEFASRANALNERVMMQGAGIRDYYTRELGIDMSSEAILASLMSNRVEDSIFARDLTMAEIGGTATTRGFGLESEFVELLAQEGMDRGEAQRLFGSAEGLLPTLGALARRHGDADDDFDIQEFTEAAFLDDPEQLSRLGRLQSQEQAQFTGGAEIEFERSRATGGITGLQQN